MLKRIDINDIKFWKSYISQNTKMFVLANNKFCVRMYGTIYKFVVIRICFNQLKPINRIYEQYIIS